MNRNDDLLGKIGRRARDTDPLTDERWDALAAGTLTPAEVEELRARARAGDVPEAALEAFRHLDDDEQRELVEVVLHRARSESLPRVVSTHRAWPRASRVVVGGLVTVAAAAAMLVWMVPASSGSGAMPRYEAVVEGGRSEVRGPSEARASSPVVLPPDGRLRIILRPATGVGGAVDVRAFVRRAGELRTASALTARPEAEGAFLIEGARADLLPAEPPGDLDLVFAVARPEGLRDERTLRERMARPPPSEVDGSGEQSVRVVVVPVRLTAP